MTHIWALSTLICRYFSRRFVFFSELGRFLSQNERLHVSSGMMETFGETPLPPARPSFETVYAVGLSFLRHSLRWLGVVEHDLDDVLQEIMLAAYRGLDSFDPLRPAQSIGNDALQKAATERNIVTTPSEP